MRRPVPRPSSPRGSRRERRALAGVLALGLLAATAATVPGSGAAFTASTSNPGNVLSAAADWVAPTVSIADPGTPLRGAVALTASAADPGGSGVATVAAQYAPNAGLEASYVGLCTAASSPVTCTWDTTKVADGLYKVRGAATDKAGNAATSAVVSQLTVDNTPPAGTLSNPGSPLAVGTVTLSGTASDATSGVRQVVVQSMTGTGAWTTACTATPSTSAYSCAWAATAGTYSLRAIVTDNAGNTTTTAVVTDRVVKDVTPPTATSLLTTNGTTNGAGTIQAGDTIVLRWSEAMNLTSIIAGLSETTTVPLVVQLNATGFLGLGDSTMTFSAATGQGTPNLGLVDLGASWVNVLTGSPRFAATARARTVNGATEVVVTLGQRTGNAPNTVTSPVQLTWTPSTVPTDLAGNATSATPFAQPTSSVAF